MDLSDTGRPAYHGPAWSAPERGAPASAVGLPVVPAEEEVDTMRGRVPAPGAAAFRHRAQRRLATGAARGSDVVEAVPVQAGERLGGVALGVEVEMAPAGAPGPAPDDPGHAGAGAGAGVAPDGFV